MLLCYLPLIHSKPLTYAHRRKYALLPYHHHHHHHHHSTAQHQFRPYCRHQFLHIITPPPPSPLLRKQAGKQQWEIRRSSSAWPSADQTSHLFPLPPPEPSRLRATIINILERTGGGGGGHAGNRRESATPVLVTVVTLLLFGITIATVLASGGQDGV